MSLRTKRLIGTFFKYVVLIIVGFFMVYPLLWMFGATFKDNSEIFNGVGLIAKNPSLDGYKNAMNSVGGDINIWKSLFNTYCFVIPKVLFTVASATVTAFGFARFKFRGRNFLFGILMSTLFIPQVVLNIPQFVLFNELGWVDSRFYLAIIVPSLFACDTYCYVIPKVLFTVFSATITAFGFARFKFKGRNFLFGVLMATLFIPQVVLNIPQFVLFNNLGWVDSRFYLAIIVPSLFACDTYFVYMLIQFLRGVPVELEEAAKIDGCNIVQTLIKVIIPMIKPAIVSCALFQFMWSNNDFMGPLLYVQTPTNYPASLFVKLSMDADAGFEWNRVLAVSLISIIPSLIIFFLAQDTFVDGIAAGGVKG